MLTSRQINLVIFLGCSGLILTALYMQHAMALIPCALCITQRVFVMLVGLTALAACIHNPDRHGRRIYAALGIIGALIGGGFSARHVWLQSLPEDLVPACGPGLGYLLENFPLQQAISVLLQGDGNCATVEWTFLSLSIPAWTLVAFAGLVAINVLQLLRR